MSENNGYAVALSEMDPYEIERDSISLEPADENQSRSDTDPREKNPTNANDEVYETYGYNVNVKGSKLDHFMSVGM